jgi:nicotinate-nucleotide adenylyltransferase
MVENPQDTTAAAASPHLPQLRVGVFGGAFDPPHLAHRALAETALTRLRLDVLHILPTGQAWHKARTLTDASHRLAMCEIAFADLARVSVDAREIQRTGPSYTVDTLLELAREYPGAQLFLLLGADQLLAFKTWVRWPDVLTLATLAVADRAQPIDALAPLQQDPALDLGRVDLPFERLQMPLTNISATAIRAQAGQSANRSDAQALLVPEAVARYISHHHLYQNPS